MMHQQSFCANKSTLIIFLKGFCSDWALHFQKLGDSQKAEFKKAMIWTGAAEAYIQVYGKMPKNAATLISTF